MIEFRLYNLTNSDLDHNMVGTRSATLDESTTDGVQTPNNPIELAEAVALPPTDMSEATRTFIELNFKGVIEKLDQNAATIAMLTGRVADAEKQITELQVDKTNLEIKVEKMSGQLDIKIDDIEQYQRRQNIRIENVKYNKDDTEEQLFDSVKLALSEVDVNIEPKDVIRFHRSAAPKRNKDGNMCAQVLLKFSHWTQRRAAHGANKKARERKVAVRIHHDLTRRRYALLSRARRMIDQHLPNRRATFCYADMNSNLLIRSGANTHPFNNEVELDDIIMKLENE